MSIPDTRNNYIPFAVDDNWDRPIQCSIITRLNFDLTVKFVIVLHFDVIGFSQHVMRMGMSTVLLMVYWLCVELG